MKAITVAGGVYHERSIWPDWNQIYGSGGRAAAALSGGGTKVTLCSYVQPRVENLFAPYCQMYKFTLRPFATKQAVSFEYVHSLSVPVILPALTNIELNRPFSVSDRVVLRFGMLEGSAVVDADRCVYDPQSAFRPEPFSENGSRAKHLAIVGNRSEITALGRDRNPIAAARTLLKRGAEVVVVKSGTAGAIVVEGSRVLAVPAYAAERVFTIGTGDVFAAIFAAEWGVRRRASIDAARLASRAVATYVASMGLPIPSAKQLERAKLSKVKLVARKVYLAGPFFTLGQRWLVDEARRCLIEAGLKVFSPVHDVGLGHAKHVVSADLRALNSADVVFAILDGLDSGTIFEIGYARAQGKPVYALAQTVSDGDLKMVAGSGCCLYDDFVTAVHHIAWAL